MAGDRQPVEKMRAEHGEFPCPLERADKRQAILDAARAIARDKGFAAVTLMSVAEAMGYAPAVVYGYFATKQELLSQLSLDDGDTTEFVPQPAAVSEVGVDEATPAREASEHETLLREQAAALDGLAKRILVPKGHEREGTDAVLARLETRLAVIEKSYAELEKHQASERAAWQQQLAEAAVAAKQLQERLEESEARQRAGFAELRLSLFQLEHPNVGEVTVTPPPADDAGFVFVPDEAPQDPPPPAPTRLAYLSSARSAALSAPVAEEEPWWQGAWRNAPPLRAAALLLLLVVGVAAGAWRMMPDMPYLAASVAPGIAQAEKGPENGSEEKGLADRAEAGDSAAALLLGVEWLSGKQRDPVQAARWLKRAAEAGQPVAQNYLGVLYRTGQGVAQSRTEAARWFEMAALQGNRPAMANLGKLHAAWDEKGNYAVAARWFVRAASFGDADSAFNLAVLYERGAGVPQSRFDAYKWYAVAAAKGDAPAALRAKQIGSLMALPERAAAREFAREFKPLPVSPDANTLPRA